MVKRVLHTSDWHIGRRLKTRERFEEYQKFFNWLENIIVYENIDALLVAGDIFDNTTPSTKAQDLYYSFLAKIMNTNCRHVIIISGNHDSPALLDAPKEILRNCDVHVVGTACENPEDEIINLNGELIVCAVPYLRDRDVRTLKPEDNIDAGQELQQGIANHYTKLFERAEELQRDSNIPVIAMGHLFARGGKCNSDEGVRSLYVGTAVDVSTEIFPDFLTYTALGHLHSPQFVGRENIRYSGSPLPMTFSESKAPKSVYVLDLDGKNLAGVHEIEIPVFQRLARIKGNIEEIYAGIQEFIVQGESVWLEIIYNGDEVIGDLQEKLSFFTKSYPFIEILSIYDDSKRFNESSATYDQRYTLENIKPLEMFELLLDNQDISQKQREAYIPMYQKILRKLEID